MSSKIDIQKRCKWCSAIFTAHKTTTEYCSHRCANLAYKDRVRKQRIESLQHELGKSIKTHPNLNKEYLTPSEVAVLLNIGRTSIYRYIRNGVIKVIRFERKTLVRRADIEDMTVFIVPETENKQLKEKAPITDFYTTAEVKEKYHVNESWIFVVAKKNNIPRTFNRGKTYWSKKHVDAYFAKKAPNPDITEWYSTQENYREIKELAEEYYNERFERGNEFLLGAIFYNEQGLHKMASFNLHQACENYYNSIILTFTLYSPKEHSLIKLSARAKTHSLESSKAFPRNTEEEKRLFDLLQDAYVQARYSLHFRITQEDIEALIPKVELLRDIARQCCEERIKVYAAKARH